jgi:hypothetical protein
MEPRKEGSTKYQELQESEKEVRSERKSRFQIVKLEKRIAPHCGFHAHPVKDSHYRRCLG